MRPPIHPTPPPMVGTLFLMMIECIFKFDGQIENVHVCNLTNVVFLMVCDMFIFNLREKSLISEKVYSILEKKFYQYKGLFINPIKTLAPARKVETHGNTFNVNDLARY